MKKTLILLYCLILYSCSSTQKKPFSYEGWAMKMPYKVIIGQDIDADQIEKILHITNQTIVEVDSVYNNWNPSSEISHFNEHSDTTFLKISKDLKNLLAIVDFVHHLSEKRFDPTVAPLSMAFHKAFNENREFEYEKASSIGWHHIALTEDYLMKKDALVTLDLCGISKGYFLDIMINRLQEKGIANALVEWAGEIRVIGKKKTGSWKVQIDKELKPIVLENEAIATSGSEHHFITKNQDITHVINPLKKRPQNRSSSIKKVSVKAPTCAVADALATAAMTFESRKEAQDWAQKITEKQPEITFWFF